MFFTYTGNSILDRRISAAFHVLFCFFKFPVHIRKKKIFFIGFHTHNDHVAVTIFCNKNRFFFLMAYLRNCCSIFLISYRNYSRHLYLLVGLFYHISRCFVYKKLRTFFIAYNTVNFIL